MSSEFGEKTEKHRGSCTSELIIPTQSDIRSYSELRTNNSELVKGGDHGIQKYSVID